MPWRLTTLLPLTINTIRSCGCFRLVTYASLSLSLSLSLSRCGTLSVEYSPRLAVQGYIKMPDKRNRTALHYACRQGAVECVRLLIDNGESPRNPDRPDGLTPLHAAILGGHLECVRECLKNGAELSDADRWGRTVAHIAVLANSPSTLAWVADENANLQQADKNGIQPLHLAAFSGAYVALSLSRCSFTASADHLPFQHRIRDVLARSWLPSRLRRQ